MQTQPFDTIAEKYASSDISVILFTEEKTFTVATLKKNPLNDRLYEHVSTKKDMATKRLRTYHGINNDACCRNVIVSDAVTTVSVRHTSDLKRVLHLSVGQ